MSKFYRVVRESISREYLKYEEPLPMRGPRDVFNYAKSQGMDELPVEEFRVLLLDSQHRLIYDALISRGTLNASVVHPREVFAAAIHRRAAALVLVHNHPSGEPVPSVDDKTVTTSLVAAGRLLDMPVQDHIIVGKGKYTSFAEQGLM